MAGLAKLQLERYNPRKHRKLLVKEPTPSWEIPTDEDDDTPEDMIPVNKPKGK
jgi:hypothetical protein